MNDPILILNFKNYLEVAGKKSVELAKIAEEVANSQKQKQEQQKQQQKQKIQIVVAPPQPSLALVRQNVNIPVISQHVDDAKEGSSTGFFVPEISKSFGVDGSLINHSEHRIAQLDTIGNLVNRLHQLKMVSIVCAQTPQEVSEIAKFEPDFIAIEPPELIGSGKAVSKENPSIITNSIQAAANISKNVKVICGAGITDRADVSSALEIGAKGILVASGVVKAQSWSQKISELASGFHKQ